MQYALPDGRLAAGAFPHNPNGSLADIAGICDPSGRIFGLMPHPEAYTHVTHHPEWTRWMELQKRTGNCPPQRVGDGIRIFENAVGYFSSAA
jgi:phosphoribosylformylglycinamidine synthase